MSDKINCIIRIPDNLLAKAQKEHGEGVVTMIETTFGDIWTRTPLSDIYSAVNDR